MIALDVETTLVDRALCLIQIGVDDDNAVIDPRAVDLEPLAEMLESQAIRKIIHNAAFERGVLLRSNIAVANIFDTLAASRRSRGRQAGGHSLAAVCRRELDKVLDKSQQTSDWTRRPLTSDQISYAALDVEVLVALHRLFSGIQPELGLLDRVAIGACSGARRPDVHGASRSSAKEVDGDEWSLRKLRRKLARGDVRGRR